MNIPDVKATTECRLNQRDLAGTVKRLKPLLNSESCPHPHVCRLPAGNHSSLAAYVIIDSNCHAEELSCDKEEGNFLWVIAADERKDGWPAAVGFELHSLEPQLLQFSTSLSSAANPCDRYESKVPLWVTPLYAKVNRPYCEGIPAMTVKHHTDVLRRAIVRIEIEISSTKTRQGRVHKHVATISVAILPDEEREIEMSDIEATRVGSLEENIRNGFELLGEYENALLYESDPGTRMKYSSRIAKLRKDVDELKEEYTALKSKAPEKLSGKMSKIEDQLDEMNARLGKLANGMDDVVEDIGKLKKAVLAKFDGMHRNVIAGILSHIPRDELQHTKALLEATQKGIISGEESQSIVDEVTRVMDEINARDSLPPEAPLSEFRTLSEAFDDPKLDLEHKLELSIPIIPFILKYKGLFKVSERVHPEKIWVWLKEKLRGKQ